EKAWAIRTSLSNAVRKATSPFEEPIRKRASAVAPTQAKAIAEARPNRRRRRGYAERTFSRLAISAARFSAVSLSRLSWRHLTAGKLAAAGSPIDVQSGLPRRKES